MRLLLQILGAVALVLLIFCLGMVAHVLYQIAPSVQPLVRDTHMMILELTLTGKNLREASSTWKKASEEQSEQTTAAMSNVGIAAKQLTLSLGTITDHVSGLLMSAEGAIVQQSANLSESQKQLQNNLMELSQATQQAQMVLADPAIKESLDNFSIAAQNIASATSHADKTVAKVEQGVTYEVDSLMKPVNKVKAGALLVIQAIGRLYGF